MNKIYIFISVVLLSKTISMAQSNSESLDKMIISGIEDWHIPGLVAAVYHKDQIVFSKTYGLRNLENNKKVNENTVFNLASSTKSIICFGLGILVDEGKISWEDKVRNHLPNFRLSDPYITENARIKDLLIHNLGIEDIEILDSLSTKRVLNKYSLAPKSSPFRGGFYYSNLAYVVAGEVIRKVSGEHWTTFVTEKIFKPMFMNNTFAKAKDIIPYSNYATPYYYFENDGFRSHPLTLDDEIGACGNIWSCLSDMENYLEMLTNKGSYKGHKILEPETFDYILKPHTIESISEIEAIYSVVKPTWRTYGLGWFQHDYRGEKLDFHPGNIDGLNAMVAVMESKGLSVVIFANRDWAELRHAILYKAIDLWAFNDDSRNWHKEIFNADKKLVVDRIEAYYKKINDSRIIGTRPNFTIKDFEGTYFNSIHGDVNVSSKGSKLFIEFNNYITFKTEHWHYDIYRGSPIGRLYWWKTFFNFQTGNKGFIDSFVFMDEKFEKR